MELLSARAVTLGVPGRTLLRDFELTLAAGELVGVVGASGSGKTQLLRAIAGLRDVDAGEFSLGGAARSSIPMPTWRRRVTYLGQRAVMLKGSVRDNLERPLAYASVARPFDLARAKQELSRLGLAPAFLSQEARSLSVGEQQRVALVRAASIEPDVLLLDEPTSALDAESVEAVESWLKARAEDGLAGVVVSHDAAQLARLTGTQLDLKNFAAEATDAG